MWKGALDFMFHFTTAFNFTETRPFKLGSKLDNGDGTGGGKEKPSKTV